MTKRVITSHPVWQTIQHAAYHGTAALPTAGDLDRLGLPPALRKRVDDACLAVARVKDTGDGQRAHESGREFAWAIVSELTDEQLDPAYIERRERAERIADMSPEELADLVPRAGALGTDLP